MLEMVNLKPLFAGVSETDQLKRIFKIRGTPNEKTYPDVKSLCDWNVDNCLT
jgi:cyclin-dependent kinase